MVALLSQCFNDSKTNTDNVNIVDLNQNTMNKAPVDTNEPEINVSNVKPETGESILKEQFQELKEYTRHLENEVEENEVGIKKQDSNLIPAPCKYLESSSNNSHGVATNNTLEDLCEVNITLPDTTETIQLRKPNEVYYEIYHSALKKAKHMRNVALDAFLEAKNIKERYMLTEIDEDSDNEETENQDDLG